jgi:hypothetical protein
MPHSSLVFNLRESFGRSKELEVLQKVFEPSSPIRDFIDLLTRHRILPRTSAKLFKQYLKDKSRDGP